MKNKIEINFPQIANGSTLIVEAGHIYTHETPNLEHIMGARLGGMLSGYLQVFGADVSKWLFVDNYNPGFEDKPQDLNLQDYVEMISDSGFKPDKIKFEADLVDHAKEAIRFLESKNYAGERHDGKIVLYKGGLLLHDPEEDKFACSLLDACLYQEKLNEADGCITVLDRKYAPQQKGTLIILKKLGVETGRIVPFLYSTPINGNVYEKAPVNNPDQHTNGKIATFVQPAIDLLQLVAQLSGTITTESLPEYEVSRYGI